MKKASIKSKRQEKAQLSRAPKTARRQPKTAKRAVDVSASPMPGPSTATTLQSPLVPEAANPIEELKEPVSFPFERQLGANVSWEPIVAHPSTLCYQPDDDDDDLRYHCLLCLSNKVHVDRQRHASRSHKKSVDRYGDYFVVCTGQGCPYKSAKKKKGKYNTPFRPHTLPPMGSRSSPRPTPGCLDELL